MSKKAHQATLGPSTTFMWKEDQAAKSAADAASGASASGGGGGGGGIADWTAAANDPWWPTGRSGEFHNHGLANWHGLRQRWKKKTVKALPKKPPIPPYDDLIEGLANRRRTFLLPGPIRLPDLIEVYTDIWEVESGY